MSQSESRIFAGIIPSYVLSDPELTQSAKLLYGVLAGFAANQRECFAGNKALATSINIDPRHVRRCLRELVDKNHLELVTTDGLRQIRVINNTSIIIDMGGRPCPGGRTPMSTLDDEGGRTPMSTISTTTLKGTLSSNKKEITQKSDLEIVDNVITTVKDCPLIKITAKEKAALITRYKSEGLSMQDLKDGCELFDAWLQNAPSKAAKLKSHYRCLIGWVLREMLTTAKIRADKRSADLRLERSKQVSKMPLPGENPQDTHARKINLHRANQNGRHLKTNNGTEHVGSIVSQVMANRQRPGGD